ncbi:hypothetical protein H8B09_01010 [Paenibacillus sp. PR3]|uniref:Uncharacterized protein n=1 Tax=Paenibacillus terricola TaxID=2763503 RepID=A0ABR8MMS3_9BACL|nr:DUF6220 domain-containing protein [Paenibacillus terricola]MBD3917318.1 hypothetical protein [Paenibacillus terricola]
MSRNELNNRLDTREEKVMQQRLSGPAMFLKTLAWVFAICLIAQAFLAGLAVFSDSARWTEHSRFADVFAVLPLIMLIIAMVKKHPAAIRVQCAALVGMIVLMFLSAIYSEQIGWLAAIHPVIAVFLFFRTMALIRTVETIG